jgi:hypothetical protein
VSAHAHSSRSTHRREALRVAAALGAITLLVTHPLAWQASRALPNLGDPLLNAFILGWGASRLPFGLSGVWTAPFYFPLKDTLALSEHLFGISVFTAPVVWLTGNAVLAHNLASLGSYVLAGVGMYALTRTLWGRKDAAFLAALAFAFAPHRVMHVSHLQVLMSGWMPISLWGLHRYFSTGSRRSLAVFAGAFALLGLSNGYFLYFFSIPAALVMACELVRTAAADSGSGRCRMPWRKMAELAVAAAAVLAAIAPAALAYLRVRQALGHRRTVEDMAAFSATWSDYLRIPGGLWLWSGILDVGAGESMLFPGLTIVALAAVAALTARRSAWPPAVPRPAAWRWHLGMYSAILVTALWLSGGPAAPGPYTWLLRALPGFDGLRAPARFIVVVALALSVLGSAGAAWLLSRLRARAGAAVVIGLGALIVLEGYGGRVPMAPFRHDQPVRSQLNAWIRNGPSGGVIELPLSARFEPFTTAYQYNTLLHGHPIVNGYSGYGYALQDFLGGRGSPLGEPDALPSLLDGLRAVGVRYVVVHQSQYSLRPELGWPDPKRLVDAIDHAAGRRGRQFSGAVAWLLDAPQPRLPVEESALAPVRVPESMLAASSLPGHLRYMFDGDVDTNWLSAGPQAGAEWVRLSFEEAIDVGRLVVMTSPYGFPNYPRRLAVESEALDGSRLTLFSGPFLPLLIEGLASGARGAPAVLELPSNRSRALWIRQTGRSDRWEWSVHELRVYRRR